MELTSYRDYRAILKDELEQRIGANSRYSLRAYARDLGISPQMLSMVLNGRKTISPEVGARVATRLGYDPESASHFVDLVTLASSRSSSMKKILEARIEQRQNSKDSEFKNLNVEAFKVIADWHHYAILELCNTKNFRNNADWIAKRLGISAFEVKQTIERLKRLELVEEKEGRLVRTSVNLSANFPAPNAALRKLAKQLLERAMESLESIPQDERDITNITMAIDPLRLPEAKQMIAEFRRKLCAFLEAGQNRSEVYTFSPALFPLSKLGDKQ